MPVVHAAGLDFAHLPGRRSADPLTGSSAAESYAVRVVQVPPGPRTPHRHPHSDEITYVVSGHGNAWEDDVRTPVGPGDVVIVPRDVPHATVAHGDDDLVLVCFFPEPDLANNLVELDGPLRD